MFVITGLGNPGRQYEGTRHNIGWAVIDFLADKHGIKVKDIKHKGIIGKGIICGHKVLLVKPLTFMNVSGECVNEVTKYYRVEESEELIVVADDINLEPGRIRIRKKGSDGGHNGLKSIIQHLGHDNFIRLRIGVGDKPSGHDLAGFVLGRFSREEQNLMEETTAAAAAAIECILSAGIDQAMNQYNKKTGQTNNKTESKEEE